LTFMILPAVHIKDHSYCNHKVAGSIQEMDISQVWEQVHRNIILMD